MRSHSKVIRIAVAALLCAAPRGSGRVEAAVARATGDTPSLLEIPDLNAKLTIDAVDDWENIPEHNVAWYSITESPGGNNNVVLWGHVLRFLNSPNIAPPLENIHTLKIGAEIDVSVGDKRFRYAVTRQVIGGHDDSVYLLPTGREQLTVISCYGEDIYSGGAVVDKKYKLITIAEPLKCDTAGKCTLSRTF